MSKEIVKIEKLVYGGEGLGFKDRKPIFISNVIPGEKVEIDIIENRKKYKRGKVSKVIEKSEKRIEPKCKYFTICGGCNLMMLDYNNQIKQKEKILIDTLKRIGNIDVDISRSCGFDRLNYRNKGVYQLKNGKIGFFKKKSNEIIEIDYCFLQTEKANKIINEIKTIINSEKIITSQIKNIEIRTNYKNEILINIVTNQNIASEISRLSDELIKENKINSVYQTIKKTEKIVNVKLIYGRKYIDEKIFNNIFKLYPNSFFQVNRYQIEILYKFIFDFLSQKSYNLIVDAFSGIGTIGLSISSYSKEVYCIELEKYAVKSGNETIKELNIDNITFIQGRVEEKLKEITDTENIDLIILDPPRRGIEESVLKEIFQNGIKEIIYISCDPSTFSRDIKRLNKFGYQLEKINMVDMFPQTYHIEVVSYIKLLGKTSL